jgi:hypothetical protein
MYLISPAPEYMTLDWRYRKTEDGGQYTTEALPEIKLKIQPERLAQKLSEEWSEIRLNVREPHPQAYVLDWHLQIGGENLIGGLHRDQYGVVLMGDRDVIERFAVWYRSLFPETQRLYFYEWADVHVELKPGMSATEIDNALYSRHRISITDVKSENLSFG